MEESIDAQRTTFLPSLFMAYTVLPLTTDTLKANLPPRFGVNGRTTMSGLAMKFFMSSADPTFGPTVAPFESDLDGLEAGGSGLGDFDCGGSGRGEREEPCSGRGERDESCSDLGEVLSRLSGAASLPGLWTVRASAALDNKRVFAGLTIVMSCTVG